MTTERSASTPRRASDPELLDEARSIIEAVNRRDVEFLMAKLSPDYIGEWPDATLERDASIEREIVMMTGIPDTHFGINTATVLGDGRVLVEATVSGTHTGTLVLPFGVTLRPTGRSLSMPFDFIMTWADGLLAHERLRFDHHVLIQQLGGTIGSSLDERSRRAISLHAAGAAGDFDTVLAAYHPDIVWTNGLAAGPWAGTFRGIDEVATMFIEFTQFFEGTFTQDVVDSFASPGRTILLLHERGEKGGHVFDNRALWVSRDVDDLTVEMWTLDQDRSAAEAFWSAVAP